MPFLWEADVRERFAYPAASGVPGSGVGTVVSVTGVCCTPQAVVKSMVSARQTAGIFFTHIASLYIKTWETWDRFHKNVGKCAKFAHFPTLEVRTRLSEVNPACFSARSVDFPGFRRRGWGAMRQAPRAGDPTTWGAAAARSAPRRSGS